METIAYFGRINWLMRQTSDASVKRCSKIWKEIRKQRVQEYYAELYKSRQNYYNWLRQEEIM